MQLKQPLEHRSGIPRVDLAKAIGRYAVLREVPTGSVMEDQPARRSLQRLQISRHDVEPAGQHAGIGDRALRDVCRLVDRCHCSLLTISAEVEHHWSDCQREVALSIPPQWLTAIVAIVGDDRKEAE